MAMYPPGRPIGNSGRIAALTGRSAADWAARRTRRSIAVGSSNSRTRASKIAAAAADVAKTRSTRFSFIS